MAKSGNNSLAQLIRQAQETRLRMLLFLDAMAVHK